MTRTTTPVRRRVLKGHDRDEAVGRNIYRLADRYGMWVHDMAHRHELLATTGVTPDIITPAAIAAARALEIGASEAIDAAVARFNRPRPVWPAGYAPIAPYIVQWAAWAKWPPRRVWATLRGLGWPMSEDEFDWNYRKGQLAKTAPMAMTPRDLELLDEAI